MEETVFENRIQHRLPRDFISTNGSNKPEDVFDNEDEAFANAISTYHKREQKPYWWKVFDAQLRDLNELLPDASVFAGLNFKDIKGNVYEYEFEDQEHKFASGQTVRIVAGESNGQNGNQAKIISLDEEQNKLSVTSSRQINSTSPIIFERSPPNTQSIERVLNIFFEAIKSQKAKTLFPLAYNILQKEED